MVVARSPEPEPGPGIDLSLVCSTIGRTGDIARLISSLSGAARSARAELIVVDQSAQQLTRPVVSRAGSGLCWQYTTSARGLSVGRNCGLPLARGRIVAFPDDDCTYTPRLIDAVVRFFDRHDEFAGLLVRAVTQVGHDNVLRYPDAPCEVTRSNVMRTGISYGIFLRREVVDAIGGFDESLGVGCETAWGAGEETDYLLRALRAGFRLWFDPALTVLHPRGWEATDRQSRERSYSYGRGIGHVLRRHNYRPHYPTYLAGRRAAKIAFLTACGQLAQARVAGAWASGLLAGYAETPRESNC